MHLVGNLFPHINEDARSKSHQIFKIYALFTLVCGNMLSIIDRLVRVLRELGVPALYVGSGRGGWVSQRSAVVAVWSF